MTRLFRSKSCTLGTRYSMPPLGHSSYEEEEEDEGYFGDFNSEEDGEDDEDDDSENPATTPFISPGRNGSRSDSNQPQFSVLGIVAAALRKSLVTCAVDDEDVASDVDIGWPTDVRHVSHVTFDRFNGFLGLPVELQPEVPRESPSASAMIFGVSAQSMQCSYDQRGNSVPTILLRMQNRLYSEGGLHAEGIFRINPENTEEENVRSQLNKGEVPSGIDVHCLSGLIKAWFRELPSGVLDSLTPEQVMHCNTEAECTKLVKQLPPTEAALLDWAINLMADVVENEHHNKMNARNIAMVFAPNMTQMADPLTALIHAVQVMNFLKTLIMKMLRDREESSATSTMFNECVDSIQEMEECRPSDSTHAVPPEQSLDYFSCKESSFDLRNSILGSQNSESNWSLRSNSDIGEKYESIMDKITPVSRKRRTEYGGNLESEGILNRLNLRKGMQKLCRHPVFQLSKTVKKSGSLEL